MALANFGQDRRLVSLSIEWSRWTRSPNTAGCKGRTNSTPAALTSSQRTVASSASKPSNLSQTVSSSCGGSRNSSLHPSGERSNTCTVKLWRPLRRRFAITSMLTRRPFRCTCARGVGEDLSSTFRVTSKNSLLSRWRIQRYLRPPNGGRSLICNVRRISELGSVLGHAAGAGQSYSLSNRKQSGDQSAP